MASVKYTKSISGDFPNQAVNPTDLTSEIEASSITIALDYISTAGDDCDIWFKAALSTGEETILDDIVAAHQGTPTPPLDYAYDDDKRLRIAVEPRKAGASLVCVTHNWCDPCTWWQESLEKTGQALTDSGDGYTFNSPDDNWIDLTHGRQYREDLITSGGDYLVKVYVNSVEKTPRAPFSDSGGDYEVDYESGDVTFFADQSGNTVTADYWYENGSLFIVAPEAGKRLWVERSEVQFSSDVVINDSIHFQPWAYEPGNPPNKIPVDSATTYKVAKDYTEEAQGAHGAIPAYGGAGARGLQNSHIVLPFPYTKVKELRSSLGVEIRVWLDSGQAFGGEFGTATFYCTSFDE